MMLLLRGVCISGMASVQFHLVIFFLQLYFCGVVSSGIMDRAAVLDFNTAAANTFPHSLCVTYQPKFSVIPASADDACPSLFVDLTDTFGCDPSDFADPSRNLSGSTVAVFSGICNDTQKALTAQGKNISSILIIDNKNSGTHLTDKVNMPVAGMALGDFRRMRTSPHPILVKIYAVQHPSFDVSIIITLFGSFSIVLIGALWSIYLEKKRLTSEVRDSSTEGRDSSPSTKLLWMRICIPLFVIGSFLLLFFFYDEIIYFFIVGFCIASSYSLQTCLLPIWSRVLSCDHVICQERLSFIQEKLRVSSFPLFILCSTVGIYWAIQRHSSYACYIQDVLGVAMCIVLLKSVRVPCLEVCTIVLIVLLCCDFFFFFTFPRFIHASVSLYGVIESTTDVGDEHRDSESVPQFIIPFSVSKCGERSRCILNFGDVIFPGVVIVYNAIFGVHVNSKMYFISSLVGYTLGMSVFLAAYTTDSDQRALLYLVPATLIPTFVVAWKRREFRAIWTMQLGVENVPSRDNGELDDGD